MSVVFKPQRITDLKAQKLLKAITDIQYVDAYNYQIKELFLIDNLKFVGKDKNEVYKSKEFNEYKKGKKDQYIHFYYKWNNSLVKCVKENDYFCLKTNRNRELITSEEQEKLRDYKIAVLGLSVGSNIAIVLAQAGISQEMVLSDLDVLDTSNLNRILAGVHQIGLNKTIVCARKIFEGNPYAKLTLLQKGVNETNLEKLLKAGRVNCVVEEIDNMQTKIVVRKLARKYKVPVLMITDNGDWAVLHIERYDLGYKKIFERTDKYFEDRIRKFKGPRDFADIVINDIVGGSERVDPRMMASVKKVFDRKFVSWPQLGSAALLGSVAVTVAIKGIVRGEDRKLFRREYLKIY